MTEKEPATLSGLCASCENAEFCAYRAIRGFDALYCELFTGSPSYLNGGAENDIRGAIGGPHAVETLPEAYGGLCQNCARLNLCVLPKPNGGVWHCEEYC